MRDTHGVGLVSHTAVLNRLVELGFEVLLPWASYLGYDLAYYLVEEHRNFGFFVHREARLVRIQVKTGRLLDNGTSFDFNTVSVAPRKKDGKNRTKGYVGRAEYYGVYLPYNRKVYMVPVEGVPTTGPLTLRFKEYGLLLGNGRSLRRIPYEEAVQTKYSLWWAEDYEI